MSDYDALRTMEARMTAQEQHIRQLQTQFNQLQTEMAMNTGALKEFIDLGKNLKVGLKFLGYVEATAVWVAKVATGLAIVYGAWKYAVSQAIAEILK
jgi:hypothetical protein